MNPDCSLIQYFCASNVFVVVDVVVDIVILLLIGSWYGWHSMQI